MSANEALFFGYVVGSIATYILFRKSWIAIGASAAFDMMVQNNYVKWRRVNGEVQLLRLDSEQEEG